MEPRVHVSVPGQSVTVDGPRMPHYWTDVAVDVVVDDNVVALPKPVKPALPTAALESWETTRQAHLWRAGSARTVG